MPDSDQSPQTYEVLLIKLPTTIKAALIQASKEQHRTMTSIVRDSLVATLGLAPVPPTAKGDAHYNSVKERLQAKAAADKKRNQTLKRLMAAYKSGKITLDGGTDGN